MGAASENDRDGVKITLNNMRKKYTNIKKMWADMGYQGKNLKTHIKEEYGIDVEIVKRPPCRFGYIKTHHLSCYQQENRGLKYSQEGGLSKGLLPGSIGTEGYQRNTICSQHLLKISYILP